MFRFKDLYSNKEGVARRIELLTPMHAIAERMIPNRHEIEPQRILDFINQAIAVRAKSKSEEQKKRLETYNDRVLINKLRKLDTAMRDKNFEVIIFLQTVSANITGNHSLRQLSNARLVEIGARNKEIKIVKED